MGRLIDSDKLIERIMKDCNGFHSQGYHTCKYDIVDIINQCDTAYDADKVVEQLKKQAHIDYPSQQMQTNIPRIMLCSAIEIIKKGGME